MTDRLAGLSIPGTFPKKAHMKDCDGELCRASNPGEYVHVDKAGRIGNGGYITYDYRCNMAWGGCPARVLVLESAVRALAVAVERRS